MSNKLKILSRDEILALDDLPVEIVEVPEWGGAVKVRGMSAEERVKWLAKVQSENSKEIDTEKAQYYAVVFGVVEPTFTEEDVEWLRKKSASALDRIAKKWLELSGISAEGAGSLEQVRGNS